MIPGEYILAKEEIQCNAGREARRLTVVNKGDRPVQIGSHFHFFEVNKEMEFDRAKAFGMRLNIPQIGPLRLDYGVPISQKGSGRFNFTVGYTKDF